MKAQSKAKVVRASETETGHGGRDAGVTVVEAKAEKAEEYDVMNSRGKNGIRIRTEVRMRRRTR